MSDKTKFAHLGKPGTAFSKGFERRLDIITKIVDFKNKSILDMACGEGVWLNEFAKLTDPKNVYGFDIDPESIENYKKNNPDSKIPEENLKVSTAEDLKFEDNLFDIVFSNEVFEHVVDDKKSLVECMRVLKPGGHLIIFTPNRGWPFETHGMFLNGKYIWGNIFLLPWMPKFIRKKYSPHVRNYSNSDIRNLVDLQNTKIIHHSHVFPAFDKLERKLGLIGRLFQKIFHALEKTPLHFFGISHLIIVKKQ